MWRPGRWPRVIVQGHDCFWHFLGKCMLPNCLPVYRRCICNWHMVRCHIGKKCGPCLCCTSGKRNDVFAFKVCNFPCSEAEILKKKVPRVELFNAKMLPRAMISDNDRFLAQHRFELCSVIGSLVHWCYVLTKSVGLLYQLIRMLRGINVVKRSVLRV